jgi:hypothetical protein
MHGVLPCESDVKCSGTEIIFRATTMYINQTKAHVKKTSVFIIVLTLYLPAVLIDTPSGKSSILSISRIYRTTHMIALASAQSGNALNLIGCHQSVTQRRMLIVTIYFEGLCKLISITPPPPELYSLTSSSYAHERTLNAAFLYTNIHIYLQHAFSTSHHDSHHILNPSVLKTSRCSFGEAYADWRSYQKLRPFHQ